VSSKSAQRADTGIAEDPTAGLRRRRFIRGRGRRRQDPVAGPRQVVLSGRAFRWEAGWTAGGLPAPPRRRKRQIGMVVPPGLAEGSPHEAEIPYQVFSSRNHVPPGCGSRCAGFLGPAPAVLGAQAVPPAARSAGVQPRSVHPSTIMLVPAGTPWAPRCPGRQGAAMSRRCVQPRLRAGNRHRLPGRSRSGSGQACGPLGEPSCPAWSTTPRRTPWSAPAAGPHPMLCAGLGFKDDRRARSWRRKGLLMSSKVASRALGGSRPRRRPSGDTPRVRAADPKRGGLLAAQGRAGLDCWPPDTFRGRKRVRRLTLRPQPVQQAIGRVDGWGVK